MAEKIEALPAGRSGSRAVRDEWLDGSAWQLKQGEDYDRSTSAMRAALSTAGRSRGLRLRSRSGRETDGTETLAVQFVPAEPKVSSDSEAASKGGRRTTQRPAAAASG